MYFKLFSYGFQACCRLFLLLSFPHHVLAFRSGLKSSEKKAGNSPTRCYEGEQNWFQEINSRKRQRYLKGNFGTNATVLFRISFLSLIWLLRYTGFNTCLNYSRIFINNRQSTCRNPCWKQCISFLVFSSFLLLSHLFHNSACKKRSQATVKHWIRLWSYCRNCCNCEHTLAKHTAPI